MFFENDSFSANIFLVNRFVGNYRSAQVRARPFSALAFRKRGEATIRFSDGTVVNSRAGDVIYLPHGVAYDATYTDMDVLAFHFHDTSVGSRAENFTPETPQVALLFEKSMQLWQVGTPSSRMEATAQFYTILSLLAVPVSSSYKESALAKAVAFLNERYADPDLCIPALCEHAAISESALRRHFCERYGKSPIKYLNELRLSEAQKRLVSTRDTVERIALDCGFRDVKYFSRAFKRYFGCTPSTLRAL